MTEYLTDNFTLEEMVRTNYAALQEKNTQESIPCKSKLVLVCKELQKLRGFLSRPIYVTSGFRCKELNDKVGGPDNSQHLLGEAADFVADGYQDIKGMEFIFWWCANHMDYRQIILEKPEGRKPWVHIGIVNGDGKKERLIYDGGAYKVV
jgi:hypothetical protein